MRSAIKVTAVGFGVIAGFAGIEHGYYELLKGNVRPDSLLINAYSSTCGAENFWHACEPAMTVIPNLYWTGMVSMLIGLAVVIWAATCVQRRHGGTVLMLLSAAHLLVGGGLIPPLTGIIAGALAIWTNRPLPGWLTRFSGRQRRVLRAVWPWSLAAFLIWMTCQYIIGYLSDFLFQNVFVILLLVLVPLLVTVPAAFASESAQRNRRIQAAIRPE